MQRSQLAQSNSQPEINLIAAPSSEPRRQSRLSPTLSRPKSLSQSELVSAISSVSASETGATAVTYEAASKSRSTTLTTQAPQHNPPLFEFFLMAKMYPERPVSEELLLDATRHLFYLQERTRIAHADSAIALAPDLAVAFAALILQAQVRAVRSYSYWLQQLAMSTRTSSRVSLF